MFAMPTSSTVSGFTDALNAHWVHFLSFHAKHDVASDTVCSTSSRGEHAAHVCSPELNAFAACQIILISLLSVNS